MKIQIEEDLNTGDLKVRIEADVSHDVVREGVPGSWAEKVVRQIKRELETLTAYPLLEDHEQ